MRTLSTNKPAAKQEAYATILRLLNRTDVLEMLSDLEVTDLERVLLYLADKRAGNDLKPLTWLKKAVAVKNLRPYLNYIIVKDRTGYASNGPTARRTALDLPDGFYDPKTMLPIDPPEEDLNSLIYRYSSLFSRSFATLKDVPNEATETVAMDKDVLQQIAIEGKGYDYKYLQGCGKTLRCDVDSNGVLRGTCKFGDYVVAPLVP